MKQKMNFITLLVFLYAGIVCSVMKPETRSGVVKQLENDALLVKPETGLADNMKSTVYLPTKSLVVFSIR